MPRLPQAVRVSYRLFCCKAIGRGSFLFIADTGDLSALWIRWYTRACYGCWGGEIGRRACLRSKYRKVWRFKSSPQHNDEHPARWGGGQRNFGVDALALGASTARYGGSTTPTQIRCSVVFNYLRQPGHRRRSATRDCGRVRSGGSSQGASRYSLCSVPRAGIEPASLLGHHFKWCVYTSSTTPAVFVSGVRMRMRISRILHTISPCAYVRHGRESNPRMSVLQTEALPLRHRANTRQLTVFVRF